jgi:decaprenylphospho-beta-D-erythro-pentofuranosid-2-ulose 2-reductase
VKAVILGGTKGMGRELARCMAERGDRVFLLGRNSVDLEKSARDLEIRGAAGEVAMAPCDLHTPEGFGPALDQASDALEGFDTVIVTAGVMGGDQQSLEDDTEACADLLTVNFANTILFCEEARRRLLARGGGNLCVFSSVAGDRGRKPVILYGATKAGLSFYMEGLDHKFHDQGLRALLVKPGFVKTGMTAGLQPPPFAGDPRPVAERVLRSLDRGDSVVYAPAIWRWVMLVIRLLPRAIMRRIGF